MLCDNVFVIFYYISVEYNTYSIVDDVEQIFSFCPKSNIEKIFGMKGVLYYGYDSPFLVGIFLDYPLILSSTPRLCVTFGI